MYLNIFYVHIDFFMLFPNLLPHKNVYSTKIFTFFLKKWLASGTKQFKNDYQYGKQLCLISCTRNRFNAIWKHLAYPTVNWTKTCTSLNIIIMFKTLPDSRQLLDSISARTIPR